MQIEILPNRKCIRENNKIISRNNKQLWQRQPLLAKQTQKNRPNHNATGRKPPAIKRQHQQKAAATVAISCSKAMLRSEQRRR